jgi:3-(3-hydroxy-phenyl)propionate hydroxylase
VVQADELTAAWGARPGEVFVVRPDRLLLARGSAEELAGLPRHVLAGGAAGAGAARADGPVVEVPADEARREAAWLALSGGIDAVPADDREGFLARLALLLADRLGTDDLRTAVATAASVR